MKEAVRYLRLAADQGNFNAQCYLGECYCTGNGVLKNMKEAVRYFRLAADQGYSMAQYNLGRCYYTGDGVQKDI